MRVLVCEPGADFSVADVHRGYVKGLRQLGCDVAEYNLNDALAWWANIKIDGEDLPGEWIVQRAALDLHRKLWEWWPDLLVVISGFYVMPVTWQLVHGRPHKTAVIFTESPYEDDRQLNLVEHAEPDVVIVNDPINIETFHLAHNNVEYLPHCYDPDVHYPGNGHRNIDFTFVGTGYPSRIRMFEQVDWDGLDVRLAGHWTGLPDTSPLAGLLMSSPDECLANDKTADLYRSARMSANLYRGNDQIEANSPELQAGWSMGPREVELAACGTPFLREPRGEGDEVLHMLPTFDGPDDFSDKLRWWLDHDDQRQHVADQACAAIQDRKFVNNARRLLELVDRT
jgi:spore maturation protein CgeB